MKPSEELRAKRQDVGAGAVMIVDGLDECGIVAAQVDIVKLVIASVCQ